MSAQAAGDTMVSAARELRGLLGSRANDAAAVREHHSRGESYHTPAAPDIVCFPRTSDEVAAIVRVAGAHRLPIVPFGAGTSLEGHVNAIRGGISIDLREMNRIVRVSVRRRGRTIEIAVRDSGSGIAADFLPHVFDRFRQGDASAQRSHGGLGLGLAIVRHLVELHGGTVTAESDGLGQGATFRIALPIKQPVGAAGPAGAARIETTLG